MPFAWKADSLCRVGIQPKPSKIMNTNAPRPNSAFPGQWIWIVKTTLSARPHCSKKKKGVRDSKPSGITIDQECDLAEGMKLYTVIDGKVLQAGTWPSVAWSYGLKCWLGIASIQSDFFRNDLTYHVQIGGEQIACRLTKLPFVKFDRYRQVPAPV